MVSEHLIATLLPLDLGDRVGLGATGRHHLDGLALLLVDQRARQRRGDRDAAFLGVGLGLADDLPDLLLIGVLVDQGHGRAELDGVAAELGDVDHVGARELVLELGDLTLVDRLLLLGGVILRVLGEIAVRARIGDLLNDAGTLDLLAMLELVFEHGVALSRHRDLFHRSFQASNVSSDKISIAGRRSAGPATTTLSQLVPSDGRPRGWPRVSSYRRNSSAARAPR